MAYDVIGRPADPVLTGVELQDDMRTISFLFKTPLYAGNGNWIFRFFIVGEPYGEVTEDSVLENSITTAGQNCKVSLSPIAPLTEEDVNKILAYFKRYLELRNFYSGSYRGFPEYDIFDEISVEIRENQTVSALITRQKITYNGSLSGEIEFYEVNK